MTQRRHLSEDNSRLKGNNAAVVSIINVHDNLIGVWDFSLVLNIDSAGFSLCEGTVNGSRTDGV